VNAVSHKHISLSLPMIITESCGVQNITPTSNSGDTNPILGLYPGVMIFNVMIPERVASF
jgi:hypothetical protein